MLNGTLIFYLEIERKKTGQQRKENLVETFLKSKDTSIKHNRLNYSGIHY